MKNDEINKARYAEFLRSALIGFCVIFFMTYKVALAAYSKTSGDYGAHTIWALEVSRYNLWDWFINKIPYPLWHLGVKICVKRMEIDEAKASALITAMYQGFAFLSILSVWSMIKNFNVERNRQPFWAVCLLVVNPLFAPWFNRNYYLGQIFPNALHNPTNIAVKCFAILSFGLVIMLIQNKENKCGLEKSENLKAYVVLSVVLFMSVLAKPSFIQGFIPGVGLFIIIRLILERKSFNFRFYIKLCAAFVPAATLILFQYIITFVNTESMRNQIEIKFAWGHFFHLYTDNLFISFLLSFAFPIFVLCMDFKKLIRSEKIQLMTCYEAASWLESVILYEAGISIDVGDFTWAGMTSALIVWITMFECYVQELYDVHGEDSLRRKILIYGGLILFAAHLMFGIIYWYHCAGWV